MRWLLFVLFILTRYVLYHERLLVFILVIFYGGRLRESAVRYWRQGTCSWTSSGSWRGSMCMIFATVPVE
jgi:hypothetical protein